MAEVNKAQAIIMLKAKVECLEKQILGTAGCSHEEVCNNCALQYTQGTIGEQVASCKLAVQTLIESIKSEKQSLEKEIKSLKNGNSPKVCPYYKPLCEMHDCRECSTRQELVEQLEKELTELEEKYQDAI